MTPSERARERLRVLLDRDGWTQREFAGKLGRSQPWLVKILSGENALRLDDLDAVAEVLKIPSGELIRQAEHELLELAVNCRTFRRVEGKSLADRVGKSK